jgi:hypothetical protein
VHDRVQAPAGVRVLEDELAQRFPVDVGVAYVLPAEVPNHCRESRRSRLVDSVAGLISIDDLGSELAQDRRHRRFARTDASRESNELHHLRCCINGR